MRFLIEHRTSYAFDPPAYLDSQTIRLRPRADAATRVVDFEMEIDPLPVVRADNLDLEGNLVVIAWFFGKTAQLDIRTRATVDTLVTDPFRFLVAEPDRTLPYAYPTAVGERLRSYRRAPDAAHPSVRAVAVEAANASDRGQASFPFELARRIHRDFTLENRPEGAPLAAEETVAAGRGACRDLAVLFVECCRAMGLAARFVSGYAYTDDTDAGRAARLGRGVSFRRRLARVRPEPRAGRERPARHAGRRRRRGLRGACFGLVSRRRRQVPPRGRAHDARGARAFAARPRRQLTGTQA